MAEKPSFFNMPWFFWKLWKKVLYNENGALKQKWHKANWSGGILIPIFVLDTRAQSFVLSLCSPLLCECVGISREFFGKNVLFERTPAAFRLSADDEHFVTKNHICCWRKAKKVEQKQRDLTFVRGQQVSATSAQVNPAAHIQK